MPDKENSEIGAIYNGEISIELLKPRGMITLKGDLNEVSFENCLFKALGLSLPKVRTISRDENLNIIWMAPDELLILVDFEKVKEYIDLLESNLKGQHFLLADVSDARTLFKLKGKGVREVLAKGTPVNMEEFKLNDARRSRVGQLPAAFWMVKANELELACFRSVSEFMFNWLKVASAPGSLPGYIE